MVKMRNINVLLLIAATLYLSVFSSAVARQTITTAEKALLQVVMQHRQLVDGAYLQVDFKAGVVRRLHPVAAHPMIVRLEKNFVLCTNFRDDQGRSVNIDFYVARRGGTHTVFQTVIDNRKLLEGLIKSGKATVVD